MNCRVCGNQLAKERVLFRCQCGVVIHGYCWERHVMDYHQPVFAVGALTLHDEFKPNVRDSQKGGCAAGGETVTGKSK